MTKQVDYQILLQEVVKTALDAARSETEKRDSDSRGALFAYYDILDVIKTQAEIMEVPLGEVGLEAVDLGALLKLKAA
jgi:hypothetical protein